MKRFALLLTLFLQFSIFNHLYLHAEQDEVHRKKVGVVLSGGGAKGMAHIGVLKVLERAGIPVDVVTGTSMGSIIGGLYAIGYNANSLDSVVRKQDWSYVITDKEDLRHQSLTDQEKQYTYAFSTGLSFKKKKFASEGGIIKGKNLAELFGHLCTGYTDSLNFSRDLKIPFACVATNIVDNTEVDFHSGRLPQAMRASMAIPAAFAPVRMGDMVLVDGGLKNNYPADLAKEMGAEVIIGVTVQGDAKTADEIKGTLGVLTQLVDVNCKNKLDDNLAITDLHMQVNTSGYNTASFSAVAIDTLVRRGEEEAMRHWDELLALKKKIGIDDTFHPVIHHPLRPKVMTEKQGVKDYIFENMTVQDERFLRQKFHLGKGAGNKKRATATCDSIDADLQQRLTTSMRVDLFYKTAECRLLPDGDNVYVLLSAGERKSAQAYVGLRFDTEEYAALQLGLDIPLKAAIPTNTELTVRLGKRIMARGLLTVHPRNFTRPSLSFTFRRNDVDVYVDGSRDYSTLYNQFQAEATPLDFDHRHFNFRAGIRWDYVHYRNTLGNTGSGRIEFNNKNYVSYRANLKYNSEDDWYFPTRGARFKAGYSFFTDNFVGYDGHNGISEVCADWRQSFTFGKRFTLQPSVYTRMLFGGDAPAFYLNTVGGDWFGHYVEQQMPFAGIGGLEFVRDYFAAVQLQGQLRIAGNHYVQLRLTGAQHADKLKELFDHRTLFGFQGAYYFKTMFGPLGATLGYSNRTKKPYFYLNLGYEF